MKLPTSCPLTGGQPIKAVYLLGGIPVTNILLSTTRMWNCGDDFIAFGVRNLLSSMFPNANYVAYNRNPDLHQQRVRHSKVNIKDADGQTKQADLVPYIQATNWRFDNSWHERHGLDEFELCVFAGTPEWFGEMVGPLVRQLCSSSVTVVYLGVGGFERRENLTFEKLPAHDQLVLRKAVLVTARDKQAADLLSGVGSLQLPCPALFSSPTERARDGGSLRIALSTQPETSLQPASNRTVYEYTRKLFQHLGQNFDCELVCHYVDELKPFKEYGLPIRYSYDARDYPEIYDQYDLVVTTRVHGAGLASSLGVPSLVLRHSARTSTADGFLAEYIDPEQESPEQVADRIQSFDVVAKSNALIAHKAETRDRYLELLTTRLDAEYSGQKSA